VARSALILVAFCGLSSAFAIELPGVPQFSLPEEVEVQVNESSNQGCPDTRGIYESRGKRWRARCQAQLCTTLKLDAVPAFYPLYFHPRSESSAPPPYVMTPRTEQSRPDTFRIDRSDPNELRFSIYQRSTAGDRTASLVQSSGDFMCHANILRYKTMTAFAGGERSVSPAGDRRIFLFRSKRGSVAFVVYTEITPTALLGLVPGPMERTVEVVQYEKNRVQE